MRLALLLLVTTSLCQDWVICAPAVSKNWERGLAVSKKQNVVFRIPFRDCEILHKTLPKSVATGPRKPIQKSISLLFFICDASRRTGVAKTLATLRSETPRALIYGVLSRQNVTFRLFASAVKTLGKAFPELPVGPPNPFIFHESFQKNGLGKMTNEP